MAWSHYGSWLQSQVTSIKQANNAGTALYSASNGRLDTVYTCNWSRNVCSRCVVAWRAVFLWTCFGFVEEFPKCNRLNYILTKQASYVYRGQYYFLLILLTKCRMFKPPRFVTSWLRQNTDQFQNSFTDTLSSKQRRIQELNKGGRADSRAGWRSASL